MEKTLKKEKPCTIAGVVRSCLNCKFASETYKLTKDGYYPPTGIYLQCNVPISDHLRDMLPTSFYRATSIKVGAVNPDTGEDVLIHSVGEDCPAFQA